MKPVSTTTQAVQLAVPPSSIAEPVHASDSVKPGRLFKAGAPSVTYRQRFTPESAGLEWLSCGEFTVEAGAKSETLCSPTDESLLFMWKGSVTVEVQERTYELAAYDTLYIPRGERYRISNPQSEIARVIRCSATAENTRQVHYSSFAEY